VQFCEGAKFSKFAHFSSVTLSKDVPYCPPTAKEALFYIAHQWEIYISKIKGAISVNWLSLKSFNISVSPRPKE